MIKIRNIILFCIGIVLYSCSTEEVFYISTEGSDQNDGSKSNPFASLEQAKVALKDTRKKTVKIILRDGYYQFEKSFVLKQEDIADNVEIIISSYPGEKVHLIGGQEISGFEPLKKESIGYQRINSKYHDRIIQFDLRTAGIEDYGELTARGFGRAIQPSGLELYFNEKPMALARWPNDDWSNIKGVPESLEGKGFIYSGNQPARWLLEKDLWLHGYWKWDWSDSYVKVAGIDTIRREILTEPPHRNYPFASGKRFYALNVLEELDAPGEWYLDRNTGIIYFWPPSDPYNAKIFVSLLEEPLIQLKNTNNVSIENLILEYSCGAGVEIIEGKKNIVKDCVLRNIGTVAISIGRMEGDLGRLLYDNTLYNGDSGTENGIYGCEIYSIGEGGIILGGGDRKTLTIGNNFAVNNNIYDCSRWVRTYRAGIFMYGVGNIVSHNLIHDLPHTAVFFWGNDHSLEYNEVYKVCMETGDAGAFYIGRDWTQRGSMIRYNYFHHLRGVTGHNGFIDVMGIYLDDWASGTTIFGNIFYKAGRSIMIGGGRDNIVENNIIIDGNPALHVDARGLGWAKYYFDGSNNTLFDRLKAVQPEKDPYKTKYPELSFLLEDSPVLPKGNKIVRNIHTGGQWIDLLNGMNDSIIYFQDNQINFDASFYTIDSNNAIQLKELNKLYTKGFQRIPFELIGLKKFENKN